MQRLLSSCIRSSRSLIYAPRRSFIWASFKSSVPVLSRTVNDMILRAVESTVAKVTADNELPPEEKWSLRSKDTMEEILRSPQVNAYSGRSVTNNRDLANSFRQLDAILVRNRVRYHVKLTERHEKKGAKRRRLNSERWRRQFANEVRKKVELVAKIRKRGA